MLHWTVQEEGNERLNNNSPAPGDLLVALIQGKKHTVKKTSQQILIPSQGLPASPSGSLQVSQTGSCWFPARNICSSAASQSLSQHHVMEDKTHCWLATSAVVMVPWTLQLTHSIQKKSLEAFLNCKRSRSWSCQQHNWGVIGCLTLMFHYSETALSP